MYVIVIMRMDAVEEIIGPFETFADAVGFFKKHDCSEDYASIERLSAPDGWGV